jgi:hypothetical protein
VTSQAAVALLDHILPVPVSVRAGRSKAGELAVDQPGITLLEIVIAQSVFFQNARTIVLDKNICLFEQSIDNPASVFRF